MNASNRPITALAMLLLAISLFGCVSTPQQQSAPTAAPTQQPAASAAAPTLSGQTAPTEVQGLGVFENGTSQPPSPPQRISTQQPASTPAPTASNSAAPTNDALVGTWSVYSSRIFYDAGGAGAEGTSYQTISMSQQGTWDFGGSTGKWSVQPITDADWAKWKVPSYGPKYKMVLEGWNNATADGPIEMDPKVQGYVDFFWTIYRVSPPLVQNAGQIQTKFGHRG